jgi:hypothetical protein
VLLLLLLLLLWGLVKAILCSRVLVLQVGAVRLVAGQQLMQLAAR